MRKLGNIISSINLNAREDKLIWLPGGGIYSTKIGMEVWDNKTSDTMVKWRFLLKISVPHNIKLSFGKSIQKFYLLVLS